MAHWAESYIGIPWESGAQGPDSYDCWSLFREVQKQHFGRDLPIIDVDAFNLRAVVREFSGNAEKEHWEEVEKHNRREGDGVLLSQAKHPSHVGVWLETDGGGVLHTVRGIGVIFSSDSALRLAGWGHIKFYRYKEK